MKKILAILCVIVVAGLMFVLFGSMLTTQQAQGQPRTDCSTTPGALPGTVPQPYNSTFTEASSYYMIDPALEPAIFMSEHGNIWPNPDGPWATSPVGATGPFQFMPSTWTSYGNSNPKNRNGDPQNLLDSAYAAAHYLKDLGAYVNMPAGDPMAPKKGTVAWVAGAYNGGAPIVGNIENDRYRQNAVAKYLEFKGNTVLAPAQTIPNDTCVPLPKNAGSVLNLMRNPNITFSHPGPELQDLASGRISPRLVALLAQIASTHKISIFALASDHKPGTNHEAGRAADIWMVDGDNCYPPRRSGGCWQMAQELDRIGGACNRLNSSTTTTPDPVPTASLARTTTTMCTWATTARSAPSITTMGSIRAHKKPSTALHESPAD